MVGTSEDAYFHFELVYSISFPNRVRVRIDEAWYDAAIGSVYFGVEFKVFKLGLVSWVGLVANELNYSTLFNN